jgi:hypothetical protein
MSINPLEKESKKKSKIKKDKVEKDKVEKDTVEKDKLEKEANTLQEKVNEINLHYLLNDFKQTIQSKKPVSSKNKKFYRKRVIQLTKDLFNDDCVVDGDHLLESHKKYHPDIYKSFESYIATCIDYFQTIDRTDILQEDYKDLEDSLTQLDNLLEPDESGSLEHTTQDADKYIMRQINMKNATLDNLVKRTVIKKEEPILPKKKKINLKDPELKNKGISKKDNLTNT